MCTENIQNAEDLQLWFASILQYPRPRKFFCLSAISSLLSKHSWETFQILNTISNNQSDKCSKTSNICRYTEAVIFCMQLWCSITDPQSRISVQQHLNRTFSVENAIFTWQYASNTLTTEHSVLSNTMLFMYQWLLFCCISGLRRTKPFLQFSLLFCSSHSNVAASLNHEWLSFIVKSHFAGSYFCFCSINWT